MLGGYDIWILRVVARCLRMLWLGIRPVREWWFYGVVVLWPDGIDVGWEIVMVWWIDQMGYA